MRKIQIEQLKLLHQHTSFMLITTSGVASIVVYALWGRLEHSSLLSWLISIYLLSVIRFVDWKWIWKNPVEQVNIKSRIILLTGFSAISGCIWGSAGLFFLSPDDVNAALLISMTLPAMVAGSTASLSVLLPAYVAFAMPTILLIAYRLLTFDDGVFTAAGVLAILFLAANLIFARTINRSIVESIKLRYENIELIDNFKQQKQLADIARDKAEQANAAKSKFLAAASHDLRQPLHALSLFIDVLKESKSEAERTGIFPRIELSLEALRKLFDALLDVSRLDAKVVKPEYSHFYLTELLSALVEEFKPEADKKNLKLKVHNRTSIVVSDRLLLERILRNLISNAIRYTNSGGVLLSSRLIGDKILLQVWDTGVGIPEESRDEIFIEFQQLHNKHRDREQGLGLGLALVRRLCDLLGHSLSLHSQTDRGSVFSISIDRGSPSLLASQRAVASPHSWDLNGRRVLVIDDEHEILHAMKTLLSKWGCDIVTADSLVTAINHLEEREFVPELVLSDLRLRDDETGIQAIDGVREKFGDLIPGILITGDTDPERIKLVKLSEYELLQKPVRPAQLRTAIHHNISVVES